MSDLLLLLLPYVVTIIVSSILYLHHHEQYLLSPHNILNVPLPCHLRVYTARASSSSRRHRLWRRPNFLEHLSKLPSHPFAISTTCSTVLDSSQLAPKAWLFSSNRTANINGESPRVAFCQRLASCFYQPRIRFACYRKTSYV